MSFTATVKNEITNLNVTSSEKIAELSAFIRSNFKAYSETLDLHTENEFIAKRMCDFLNEIYKINCRVYEDINPVFLSKKIYTIKIDEKVNSILEDLSVINKNKEFLSKLEEYIIGSTDEVKAYIRGSFFASGSINDPKTSRYHLELLFDKKDESILVQRLLNEFNLNAKLLLREKKYMIYIKDSDDISDFLKIIGASKAVMYYEDIRALKEQINITNRLNNCEQANTDKIIITSNEQIKDINLIFEKLGEDFLDEKLKEASKYRLKYPEASLLELSDIISFETNKKITKSGLNHRFRKIKQIAEKLK